MATLLVVTTETTKEAVFEDEKLEFHIGTNTLSVPLYISFEACKASKLRFTSQEMQISYKIGSGVLSKSILSLTGCKNYTVKYRVESVFSKFSWSRVVDAVLFNTETGVVTIKTNDS